MILSAGFMRRSSSGRERYRRKTDTFPLGACRSRLVQALRQMGIVVERTAAKLREEQLPAHLRAERKRARIRADERAGELVKAVRRSRLQAKAAAIQKAQRLAQTLEEERAALQAEQRRFALMLKEELTFETMSEAQQAAVRLEDQVVSWLGFGE